MAQQVVQGIVLAHVFQEVFLRPAREHPRRHRGHRQPEVRGQDGGLRALPVAVPDFAHPQAVAQTHSALGQVQVHFLAVDQFHFMGLKLCAQPIGAGMFVISQDGDAARIRAKPSGL